jgi:hypothetical protein
MKNESVDLPIEYPDGESTGSTTTEEIPGGSKTGEPEVKVGIELAIYGTNKPHRETRRIIISYD